MALVSAKTEKMRKLAEEMAREEEEEAKSAETPEDRRLAELVAAYSKASERSKEGDFQEAVSAWSKVLELEEAVQAYQERGAANANLGRFCQAESDFQKALELVENDEERASVYFSRGSARGDAGKAEAIADFGEALKLEPDRLEAWLSRGTAYLASDDVNGASADAEAALKLQSDSAPAWGLLGAVRQRQGLHREAVDACQMALKLEPDLSWAQNCLEASLAELEEDGAGFQKGGQSCADGSLPLVMAVAHPSQCEGGAYYGPHEMRKGYPIKTKNANAMAYDASVAKALWEASEKAVGEEFKL